jgi:hypothetical protein
MTVDENVLAVRQVRESLIRRHGGLDGWVRHLQAMDRARTRIKRLARKAPPGGKRSKSSGAPARRSSVGHR